MASSKQSFTHITEELGGAAKQTKLYQLEFRQNSYKVSDRLPSKHASLSENSEALSDLGDSYQNLVLRKFLLDQLK